MACRLARCGRPSHYLNQCWNVVDWTPGNKLQWNFNLNNFIHFIHSYIWKCRPENGSHFVSVSMCWSHYRQWNVSPGTQWCLTPRYTFLLWRSRSCYCPGTPMVSHPEVYLSLVVISILLLSRDPNGVSPRGIPFSCGDLDPVIVQGPQWCLTPRYTFLLWWSRSCYCPGTPMVSHPEVYLSLVVISILLLSRDPNGVSPRGIPFSCGDLDPVIVQGPQWCLTPRYTFLLWWSRSFYCPGTPMVSHPEVYLSLVVISILLLSRDPNGVSPRGIPFSCGDLDPVIVQGPQWCLTPRYTFLLWWSRSCYCPGTPMVSHPEVYLSLVAISILLLSRDSNGVSPRGIPFSCGDLDPVIVQGPQWCLTPRYTFLLWWSRSCYCPGTPMVSHPEVYLSLVAISILLLYSFILVYQTAQFILQPFLSPDKHCQLKRKVTNANTHTHIYIYMHKGIYTIISYLGMKSWDLHVCDRASTITQIDRVKKVIIDTTRYDFA